MSLKREISAIGAAVLVLNGLIGAGIFALPGKMLAALGTFSPWIFLLFALPMLSVVWCIARLAAAFPETGGPVLYTQAAFGSALSFQTGWLFYLARATAIAANAHVLMLYLKYLLPDYLQSLNTDVMVVLICMTLTLINYLGIRRAMQFLDGLTLIKVLPIIIVVLYGLWTSEPQLSATEFPEMGMIESAALLTLYAFIGFETVIVTSGETKRPAHTLPLALMGTLIGTALLYWLIQLAYVSVMQGSQPEEAPLIAFANSVLGNLGAVLIAVAAVFSVAANILANMISTSRLSFAMAEKQALPHWFARLHPRFATPSNSILFLGVLACLLSLSGGFVWLALMSVLSRMLVYLFCTLSLLRLASNRERELKPSTLLYVCSTCALGLSGWAIWHSSLQAWLTLLSACVVGGVYFYIWSQRRIRV